MEKKIGSILIVIENRAAAVAVNDILSLHGDIILGRQGIPLRGIHLNIISVVVEATMAAINSLSGQLGKIHQVQVKTVVSKINLD